MASNINIPVIEIAKRGDIATTTSFGIDPYLNAALSRGTRVHQFSRDHRFIELEPTSPHVPKGEHMVLWSDDGEGDEVGSFTKEFIPSLLKDSEFWHRAQNYLSHQTNLGKKVYSYIGFVDSPRFSNSQIIPVGLQSLPRLHIHVSDSFTPSPYGPSVSLDDQDEKIRIATLLDEGSNFVGNRVRTLNGFGKKFRFKQDIGNGSVAIAREREFFGFNSLQEAMIKAYSVHVESLLFWEDLLDDVDGERFGFAGVDFPVIQSIVPNFAIMIPDTQNRNMADKTGRNHAIWVYPYTTTGALALTQGGAIVKRATPHS